MAADAPRPGAPGEIEVVSAVAREFRLRKAFSFAKTLVPIEHVIQRANAFEISDIQENENEVRLNQTFGM